MTVRSLTLVLVSAIVAGAFAFAAAPAPAASGCAAAVLQDWHNGRLGSTYAPACYRQALSTLPEDIRIYSTAENDINRALLASLARESVRTTKVGAVKGVVRKLSSTKSSSAVERQAASAAADPSASTVPGSVVVSGVGALALVTAAGISVVTRRLLRR